MNQGCRREFLRQSAAAAAALLICGPAAARRRKRIIVWSEGSAPRSIYPQDINHAIAEGIKGPRFDVRTASLSEPNHGIPDSVLDATDVLIWWGHLHHGEVRDDRVDAVVNRVRAGKLGFIGTHSAHWSKPFKKMMGTSCNWEGGYIEDGSRVDVTVLDPRHPIARGVHNFVIPHTERYVEPFTTPPPAAMLFGGVYTLPNGTRQTSHQGMTWKIGRGRIFYFQPGHESYPIYYQEEVRQVLRNAAAWI